MLPDDVESYLAEINRVLKKGGRMLATFFLLDAQVEECIRAGRSRSAFAYDRGNCRLGNAAHPEEGVAYQVDSVRSLCARYGLTVQEPIAFGYWSGRIPNVDYQDIVVAAKERDVRQPFRLRRVLSRLKSGIRRFFRRITERDEEIVIRQAPK
jgi:hypothetical protein